MKRFCFVLLVLITGFADRLRGRALAVNAVTPFETGHSGTESLDADTTIGFFNALVKVGSDDHHFTPTTAVTDVGLGIVINDLVDTGEPGAVRKVVAILGVHPGTLPGVAAGAIAAGAFIVPDTVTPGRVKQPAGGSGAAMVIGRARFAVVNAGDPVSIIHCVPFSVTF